MRSTRLALSTFALGLLFTGALAQAATVTGTVTNKTTGKPSAGDTVELVDVQAGMKTAAHATTDGKGHYSLSEPGSGPYLIRAMHQGAGYFIAAPQGAGSGDITVYDSAAKVDGVSIEDDVLQIESENGQLDVAEQYVVHNTSSPRVTQFSSNSFEFVLPAGAVLDGAEATRPSGLPTNAIPTALGQKGHYSFNIPIQPDEGENMTVFVVHYHLPYSGKYTFNAKVLMPVSSFVVMLPKSIEFTAGSGLSFQPVTPPDQSPSVQTLLLKNALPGKTLEFSVSGNGSMPREQQGAASGGQAGSGMGGQDAGAGIGTQPGGGIGQPINTPDPLSKYKWWILGGLALLLVVAAAFLLRKPVAVPGTIAGSDVPVAFHAAPATPAAKNAALLNVIKEEMFAMESEKIHGTISADEYAQTKAALETVLKRALKKS
ncbi:MAG: carboxypeptidase-like regulatory domain-containing protein [Terracidiphilus sp.]